MGEKTKRFMDSLKQTLSNLGKVTGKTLENLEKSNKEMEEKMKKATGGLD